MLRSLLLLIFLTCGALRAQSVANLMPPPKTAFGYTDTARFRLSSRTWLVVPDTMSPQMANAVQRLDDELQRCCNLHLGRVNIFYYVASMIANKSGIVFLPEDDKNISDFLPRLFEHGENPPTQPGGYVVDIRGADAVMYCQAKVDGGSNGVATLLQLLRSSDLSFGQCHVWDQPDYPNRWVFSQHNMLVNANLQVLHDMADTMATYKLNGMQQNDFKLGILDRMFPQYFNNVDSLKKVWNTRNIEVIPGVCGIGWSSTLMYQDPQLAEGIEARTRYVMESDSGRLVPDANAVLPNGGFEQVDSQGRLSGYSYYDTCFHQDKSNFHSGTASAIATNIPNNTNARCTRVLNLKPHEYYNLSVWMKTQNCSPDEFRLLVLADTGNGQYRAITFTALNIPSTTDWTKAEVFFNTLEYSTVIVYAGLWGAHGGTLWLDDFSIKPAGLCNVLRRPGTPLSVHSADGTKSYSENQDFNAINDPWWNSPTESIGPFHTPPRFQRTTNSSIHNGDTVEISYYHPFAAVSDNQGNGSVMICVSEDTLYKVLAKQISTVDTLLHPTKYFMGHDEIRNMNRDAACLNRHLSPARLLADNMHRCDSLLELITPSSRKFMWSDMLDSLHNAVDSYYLVNGDLRGDWDLAPKDITIVNWNSGHMNPSLDFFSRHGYKQMTAPFFTAGNSAEALNWRIAQDDVSELQGMMYTTWTNEYRYLKNFAYYVWGAGAYVQHHPIDSTCFSAKTVNLAANITGDPFDANDVITGVEVVITKTSLSQVPQSIAMTKTGTTLWTATYTVPNVDWFRYTIRARNKQGFLREIPTYVVRRPGSDTTADVNELAGIVELTLQPQPADDYVQCTFTSAQQGPWNLELKDLLGRSFRSQQGAFASLQMQNVHLQVADLPSGVYVLQLQLADRIIAKTVVIRHP